MAIGACCLTNVCQAFLKILSDLVPEADWIVYVRAEWGDNSSKKPRFVEL